MTGFSALPNDAALDTTLSNSAKVTFLVLAAYSNKRGVAKPSLVTLTARAQMSKSTLQRSLEELRDYGLVTWEVLPTPAGRQRFYTIWKPKRARGGRDSGDMGVLSPASREQEVLEQEVVGDPHSVGSTTNSVGFS